MNKENIDICCMYGFSVNLLIDNIECLMEDIMCGEEITDKQIEYLKTRIKVVRKHEKPFQEILNIKPSEEC